LDPKHFSFNSARGWCPNCRGYGRLYPSVFDKLDEAGAAAQVAEPEDEWDEGAPICDVCHGDRLNPVSRAVKLYFNDGYARSLPELLKMNAADLMDALRRLRLDARGRAIASDILPQ